MMEKCENCGEVHDVLTDEEAKLYQQDFKISAEVESELETKIRDLYTFCEEQGIPFIAATITSVEREDDGATYGLNLSTHILGARAPDYMHTALNVLQHQIHVPRTLLKLANALS